MKKVTRLFFLSMLVTLATFVALVGSVSASAVPTPKGQYFKIVNHNSGKVLEASKSGQIDQRDYDGGQNQQWRIDFVFESNRSYSISNKASKFLTAPNSTQSQQLEQGEGSRITAGAHGEIVERSAGEYQAWDIGDASGSYVTIQSMKGLYIGVQGARTDNAAPVVESSSNKQSDQEWQLICVASC